MSPELIFEAGKPGLGHIQVPEPTEHFIVNISFLFVLSAPRPRRQINGSATATLCISHDHHTPPKQLAGTPNGAFRTAEEAGDSNSSLVRKEECKQPSFCALVTGVAVCLRFFPPNLSPSLFRNRTLIFN